MPQLISANNTDIVMDNHSKGWVVSLDYGTTAIIALVSGQFQASPFDLFEVRSQPNIMQSDGR